MFTFHREGIYVVENKTRESWYWSERTFLNNAPLLKYDYKGSTLLMLKDQFFRKFTGLLWVTFTFAMISMINALFIRICIKSSVLIVFPMISC